MIKENLSIRELTSSDLEEIILLTKHLNPDLTEDKLRSRTLEMFEFDNYKCFGLYDENQTLLGLTGLWITVRLYSGKQIELDHLIINPEIQSKGIGRVFLNLMEIWAKENACDTAELNTYVQNSKSHKFYFNTGYQILGYHFQKNL